MFLRNCIFNSNINFFNGTLCLVVAPFYSRIYSAFGWSMLTVLSAMPQMNKHQMINVLADYVQKFRFIHSNDPVGNILFVSTQFVHRPCNLYPPQTIFRSMVMMLMDFFAFTEKKKHKWISWYLFYLAFSTSLFILIIIIHLESTFWIDGNSFNRMPIGIMQYCSIEITFSAIANDVWLEMRSIYR